MPEQVDTQQCGWWNVLLEPSRHCSPRIAQILLLTDNKDCQMPNVPNVKPVQLDERPEVVQALDCLCCAIARPTSSPDELLGT